MGLAGSAGALPPEWFDLITEDAAAAHRFYGKLFGWKIEKQSATYAVASLDGRSVAGIAQINGRLPDASEDFWLLGVEVDDVDAVAQAARAAGGRIHSEPDTAPGHGRYAVIIDPQGAALALWKPEGGTRASPRRTGDWVWTELWTDDPSAAVRFYKTVLGYEHRGMEVDGETYHVFTRDADLKAGILKTPFTGIEPNWVPYILVDDLHAVIERARKLGGRVLLEPQEKLGKGEVALIADPAGAAFFVHEAREEGGAGS
jgi:predicted enzyme related to lactoylglutathione lyase